jgi:ribosomal protein L14E/L6E/L27E
MNVFGCCRARDQRLILNLEKPTRARVVVEEGITVADLLAKCSLILNEDDERMMLVFGGDVIKDTTRTLADVGIHNQANFSLVIQKKADIDKIEEKLEKKLEEKLEKKLEEMEKKIESWKEEEKTIESWKEMNAQNSESSKRRKPWDHIRSKVDCWRPDNIDHSRKLNTSTHWASKRERCVAVTDI